MHATVIELMVDVWCGLDFFLFLDMKRSRYCEQDGGMQKELINQ